MRLRDVNKRQNRNDEIREGTENNNKIHDLQLGIL